MRERLPLFAGVGLFAFAILSMSLFSVDQRQHARWCSSSARSGPDQ